MSKQTYDNYIVFLLGADDFAVSHKIRKLCKVFGMDEMYAVCVYIAKVFEKYDNLYWDEGSQYDNFARFLEDYNDDIMAYIDSSVDFDLKSEE